MKPDVPATYFTNNEALLEAVKSCDDLKTLKEIEKESQDRFERLQMERRLAQLPSLVAFIRNFIETYGNFYVPNIMQ